MSSKAQTEQYIAGPQTSFLSGKPTDLELCFDSQKEKVMKKLFQCVAALLVLAVSGCAPQDCDDQATAEETKSVDEVASDQETLYQRIGGYDVVAAIIDDMGPRALNDPALSMFFTDIDEESGKRGRQLAVNLVCELAGGPCFYTGRDMKTIHDGLAITDEQWHLNLGHLGDTLDALNIAGDEKSDVIAIFAGLKEDIVGQ